MMKKSLKIGQSDEDDKVNQDIYVYQLFANTNSETVFVAPSVPGQLLDQMSDTD